MTLPWKEPDDDTWARMIAAKAAAPLPARSARVDDYQPPEQALRFFELLGGFQGRPWHYRAICPKTRTDLEDAGKSSKECSLKRIADLNAAGWGAFAVINEGGSDAESITKIHALYVDFDKADDHLDRLSLIPFEPSLVVESSPGKHHVYWLVDDFPVERFSASQQRLIGLVDSDPIIHDLCRIMRIPGYLHTKDKDNLFETRIVSASGIRYAAAEFLAWLDTLPAVPVGGAKGERAAGTLAALLKGDDLHNNMKVMTLRLVGKGVEPDMIRKMFDGCRAELEAKRDPVRVAGLFDGELDSMIEWAVGKGFGAEEALESAEKQRKLDSVNTGEISLEELSNARCSPRVVLEDLLYADLRFRIAAGGVGKTTLACFEAVTLALGRPLWGRQPEQPVKTCFVSREDGREIIVARIREVMKDMHLSIIEQAQALKRIRVYDLTGVAFRICKINRDVVDPHAENLEWLLGKLREFAPDWLILDPLVSFGVGENRVNDAEQGLVEAFRILRNELDACIEGIHHTGKANARDKADDQYASRGGSSLPDGSRMMVVINTLEPDEFLKRTGERLVGDETGLVMNLPKLSYTKPQEPIFIARDRFRFRQVLATQQTPEEKDTEARMRVLAFITSEFEQGRRYSQTDMETKHAAVGVSRNLLRGLLTDLKVRGQVLYHSAGKGKSGAYFEPVPLPPPAAEVGASSGDPAA